MVGDTRNVELKVKISNLVQNYDLKYEILCLNEKCCNEIQYFIAKLKL